MDEMDPLELSIHIKMHVSKIKKIIENYTYSIIGSSKYNPFDICILQGNVSNHTLSNHWLIVY